MSPSRYETHRSYEDFDEPATEYEDWQLLQQRNARLPRDLDEVLTEPRERD